MKTKIKTSMLTSVLIILFSLLASNSYAQCSTKITNQLSCAVTVDIVVYDTGGGCTNICNSQFGIAIPPNSSININCGGCGSVCNIEVTVTDINGSPSTPTMANFTNGIQTINNTPLLCSENDIRYDSGGDTFKIN